MTKGKVIRTFQERRTIETALLNLSRLQDEEERLLQAQDLAAFGDGVIPVIRRHLDTTDPLLRGTLGLVAAQLPRDLVVPALRAVVGNPGAADQERMAALMILERFLDEPVDADLYANLRNPEAVMLQSLREVVDNQDRVPSIVLDYVGQLQEEPVDVALMVIDATQHIPAEATVPILSLLAQDVREEVAWAAVTALGRVVSPQGVTLLEGLAEVLPEPLQSVALRGARKLRMRGVSHPEREDVRWRVLLAPPDMNGVQVMWMLQVRGGEQSLLGVLISPEMGLQFAFWLQEVPTEVVPPLPDGERLLTVNMGAESDAPVWFLEVSVAYARTLLRQAARRNYVSGYQLPVVYREHAIAFWRQTADAGFAQAVSLPEPDMSALPGTLALFQHPAFVTWYVEPPRNVVAEQRWLREGLDDDALMRLLGEIREDFFRPAVWSDVATRLHDMSRWLALAGEDELARYAVTAAESLTTVPYAENPFAQALVARGLVIAFNRLQETRERWNNA